MSPVWGLGLFPGRRFRAGMDFLMEVHSDVKPELDVGTLESCDVTKSCQNKRQTRGAQEVPTRRVTVQPWGREKW